MKLENKKEFMKDCTDTINNIYDLIVILPSIKIDELQYKQTALVIVDLVNGFAKEGALNSPRVKELISEIVELYKNCDKLEITKLAFADCHTESSPEFEAYPIHCLQNSYESEIVDEIKEIGGYTLIQKNSTNGFLEEKFQKWLNENAELNTFVITGDCTDICVQQFAITLKTFFNMLNKKVRIIVPINLVEKYDYELHNGNLMNLMAIYNMIINGIEIVKEIEF